MAALGTILVGAGTGPLMLLMMMYMFDIFAGMTTEPHNMEDDYELSSPQSTNHGPIMSFFTQSWRNNSINRKNFATSQTAQLIMMASQLYLALISAANGDLSPTLAGLFSMFVCASVYAFFSSTRVTGIDALQSNGAMVTLMGAGTMNIVMGSAGAPFYFLYMLLAVDCMASFSTYFS